MPFTERSFCDIPHASHDGQACEGSTEHGIYTLATADDTASWAVAAQQSDRSATMRTASATACTTTTPTTKAVTDCW